MFILKKGHQPGVYMPLRALFLVTFNFSFPHWIGKHMQLMNGDLMMMVQLMSDMSLVVSRPVFGVSDTNWAVLSQNMARGLKFHIYEVEGLYYLCSENKGADQLRGYREADLRLCFRICRKPVFS